MSLAPIVLSKSYLPQSNPTCLVKVFENLKNFKCDIEEESPETDNAKFVGLLGP